MILSITSLILALSVMGCGLNEVNEEDEAEPFERRELPRQLSEQEAELANGTSDFGLDLMHRLVEDKPDQNHFISPLSIQMAYGMAINGSEGETYAQYRRLSVWAE